MSNLFAALRNAFRQPDPTSFEDDFLDPERRPLQRNGIVLRRMTRRDENAWQSAKSWLGGLPRMDPLAWPPCKVSGQPLHHLAHINLADLPEGPWQQSLPATGALSFFVGTCDTGELFDSAVVYIPNPEDHEIVDVPDDCPPIDGDGWATLSINKNVYDEADAARVMTRWPVEFVSAEFDWPKAEDDHRANTTPPLEDILGPCINSRLFPIPDRSGEDTRGAVEDIGLIPWEAARRVVTYLGRSAPSSEFVTKWREQVVGQNAYAPMGIEAATAFESEEKALRYGGTFEYKVGEVKYRYGGNTTALRDAAEDVILEMMLGPRELYDKVPRPCREFIETHLRHSGTADGAHQMFGISDNIQGVVWDNLDYELLFQVESDPMMNWQWFDVGVWQFWISPDNLAKRSWDKAAGNLISH